MIAQRRGLRSGAKVGEELGKDLIVELLGFGATLKRCVHFGATSCERGYLPHTSRVPFHKAQAHDCTSTNISVRNFS